MSTAATTAGASSTRPTTRREMLEEVFLQNATITDKTEKLMAKEGFFACITLDPTWTSTAAASAAELAAPASAADGSNEQAALQHRQTARPMLEAVFRIADRRGAGHLTFADFLAFDDMMHRSDAEYELAFRMFDTQGKGTITFDNFKRAVNVALQQQPNGSSGFDFASPWVQLYFLDGKRQISYKEFTQLLKGFHEERLRQAFVAASKGTGYISGLQFAAIETAVYGHRMSPALIDRLVTLGDVNKSNSISFAHFSAFNSLIHNLDSVYRVMLHSISLTKSNVLTKEDFMHAAHAITRFDQITPLEVDILFHLCESQGDGRITPEDFQRLLPVARAPSIDAAIRTRSLAVSKATTPSSQSNSVSAPASKGALFDYIESFALGSIAGAIGATVVFPIDLVKTRMQNQRGVIVGEMLYRNSWDCFTKVLKNEGVSGLYRGLVPQLVGVAPEKAIKLAMNDLCRKTFKDENGNLSLPYEILSGGVAGASQVVFTNPLEIVKIRLHQPARNFPLDAAAAQRPTAGSIVRQLGFMGLYKGATACLLRDVPFSMIYFPAYAHAKAWLAKPDGSNDPHTLLLAGALAGIPAASLVTPADVIKTRLQVAARRGELTYTGIVDCARKIMATEGGKAFWKGAAARVFRSSPQFGVTLFSYEMLIKVLHPELRQTAIQDEAVSTPLDFQTQHSQRVWATFQGVHNKFGLWLPSFAV
ncbi:calcium-binding carrier protein [Capsaspora owczarzaki ATCC 30864]|uniref:Calcium-binding carrier protein n=1 Tax=Capsaspora owczarzaki (strain ATCC 30864) TaxID=595528 RepID=A0A0D2VFH3_CAPO3|nr:calcium-binding carrier protein [Capsaspora owczarzaki ATCC 30864]